jgi:predicted lipid carrier protein YhbT
MSFTQTYGSILLLFIQNYKDAKNEKARKGVVETATNAILNCRNLLEEQGLDLPQNLKAVHLTTLRFSFH